MNFLEAIEAMKKGHVVERDDKESKIKILNNCIYSQVEGSNTWDIEPMFSEDLTGEWNIVTAKLCPHCGKELEEGEE